MKAARPSPNSPNNFWMTSNQPQQAAQPTLNQPSTPFLALNLNIYKSPNPTLKDATQLTAKPTAFILAPQSSAAQDRLPILFSGCSWNIYLILQFCQTTFPLMSFHFNSQLDLQAASAPATRISQLNTHSCALQIDSISQFLELRPSPFKQQSPFPDKHPQTDSKSDQQHTESLQNLERPPSPARPAKKPSLFHNFQKHLITTIRACVRLKPVLHHRRSTAGLAHQLWEYFVGQKRPSKRFLLSFLGRGKGDNKSSLEESGFRKEFQHLLRYFNEYSAGEVQEAQEYLCREITRQGRKIILQEQASIGRINRPREFRLYFAKFIEELDHGEVRRRLPKLVKMELTNANAEESD